MLPTARIDAHQHYWQYEPAAYAWLDDSMRPLRRHFTPDEAWHEMRQAGFERSIAVQVRQSLEETRWLLALADAHPFIAGVVGWVDLGSPAVEADLDAIAAHRKLIGVRHIVQAEPDGFLASPGFRRGVARLDRYGLTYDLLVYARQLPEALAFVRALPEQRFIVDHWRSPTSRAAVTRRGASISRRSPNCRTSGANYPVWSPKPIGMMDAGGPASGTPDGARLLRPRSADDRIRLARLHGRRLVCADDTGRGRRAGGCAPAERASVLGGTAQRPVDLGDAVSEGEGSSEFDSCRMPRA